MESAELKLEQLVVSGDARAMGRAQGEHFRERALRFMEEREAYLRRWLSDRGSSASGDAYAIGARSMSIAASWDPEGHAEHLGIAEGIGVDPVALYTAANLTDIRDVVLFGRGEVARGEDEGCTSLLVPPGWTAAGEGLAGQTWDLNWRDTDYVVAIQRNPTSGPRTWSVTCVGCLTLMGINDQGLAVGTTNIKTRGAVPGVGYMTVLHRAIRCADVAEASAVVEGSPRAGAHTYWLADPAGLVEWEATTEGAHRRDAAQGPIFRTNHCLHPEARAIEAEPPTPSSVARYERMRLLTERRDLTPDNLRALFADRSDDAWSVNRYPEDKLVVATNAVFIASPARREAWACRGPADRGAWVRLGFG